eukprot:GEMP01105275.1.p2 GENE.GEMP01105275.1~~GEMP01105275.1.p2  ORF type:complete len:106 (-),score=3.54 GEMP01105275.1:9-326(-)
MVPNKKISILFLVTGRGKKQICRSRAKKQKQNSAKNTFTLSRYIFFLVNTTFVWSMSLYRPETYPGRHCNKNRDISIYRSGSNRRTSHCIWSIRENFIRTARIAG